MSFKVSRGRLLGLGLGVVAVGAAGVSYYFYSRYQHAQELLKDPTAAATEELNQVVHLVGEHFLLPEGEIPTVATVSDKSKLADQPFFAKSEMGDKVLIYSKAGQVILYRPNLNKIIEVATVTLAGNVAGTSTQSAQLKSAKLAIFNSTDRVGLASVAEKKLLESLPSLQTVAKLNSQGTFTKSMVVVLVPEAGDLGKQLGEIFKAEVMTNMPAGETRPDADLLLIVGQDFQP